MESSRGIDSLAEPLPLESVKQLCFLFLSSDSGETAYVRISQLRPSWIQPNTLWSKCQGFSYCHIRVWLQSATLYSNQGHKIAISGIKIYHGAVI